MKRDTEKCLFAFHAMPIPNHILAIPPICAALGVRYAVTSPGSRSAALTISFAEFPDIQTLSTRDERVAGYMALGLAQMSKTPVVLICTSGTAALNLAPAIAEAYFLQVPLLVLTADRPQEWIHQYDGQTIFQDHLFGRHVKKSYHWLPEISQEQSWFSHRTLSESIWLTQTSPAGPVHVNVPIREPFYPEPSDYPLAFPSISPIFAQQVQQVVATDFWPPWLDMMWKSNRPLWVAGQQDNFKFSKALAELGNYIPVVGDCISQLEIASSLHFQDAWSSFLTKQDAPDWFISSDKSILSKPLKTFLRNCSADYHIHVQMSDQWVDPFQSLKEWLAIDPVVVVERILDKIKKEGVPEQWTNYKKRFDDLEAKVSQFFLSYSSWGNTDASFVQEFLMQCSADVILHGGNSMPIRYLNLFYGSSEGPKVYCNRGTSGIDGSLSTAVGSAIADPTHQHIALVGDVSFWYDSNALWQNQLPSNLKVVLLNNRGGNIFQMIPGPVSQPSFKTFFQTEQSLTAEGLSASFGFAYKGQSRAEISPFDWNEFWTCDHFLVWEIFTDPSENQRVMKKWREDLAAQG